MYNLPFTLPEWLNLPNIPLLCPPTTVPSLGSPAEDWDWGWVEHGYVWGNQRMLCGKFYCISQDDWNYLLIDRIYDMYSICGLHDIPFTRWLKLLYTKRVYRTTEATHWWSVIAWESKLGHLQPCSVKLMSMYILYHHSYRLADQFKTDTHRETTQLGS